MTGRDLLDAMEYIDDELIEEAAHFRYKRAFSPQKWAAVAASAAVICVSVFALNEWRRGPESSGSGYDMAANPSAASTAGAGNSADSGGMAEEIAAASGGAPEEGMDTTAGLASDYADITQDNTTQDTGIQEAADSRKQGDAAEVSEAEKDDLENIIEYIIIEDFPPKQMKPEPDNTDASEIVEESYAQPEKGTYACSRNLTDAMDYYEKEEASASDAVEQGQNQYQYQYHVSIAVFGDTCEPEQDGLYGNLNLTDHGRGLLAKEYDRLLASGYDVSLSEEGLLTGLFTKAELETFDTSPEYGYMFYLAEE